MNKFQDVKTFVFFVGYPRSGHSLLGACLDAHPNAVVSHELDVLALLKQGINRNALFEAIIEKAQSFYNSGSEWSGYSYRIPGMWQGRHETIRLIGDKRGGASAVHLLEHPELLEEVKKLASNCKLIHVVRNPFDCIATAVARQQINQQRKFSRDDLIEKAGSFFQKASTINSLIAQEKKAVFTIRYEKLLDEPWQILLDLTKFLNLPIIEEWLHACTSIIWPSAHKSRHKIELWDQLTIDFIQEKINMFPFFEGYTFQS